MKSKRIEFKWHNIPFRMKLTIGCISFVLKPHRACSTRIRPTYKPRVCRLLIILHPHVLIQYNNTLGHCPFFLLKKTTEMGRGLFSIIIFPFYSCNSPLRIYMFSNCSV